ncbi:Gfo/Idh/MocA family protein [Mucilaginibacter puniceus]
MNSRRNFLQKMGLSAVALSLAPIISKANTNPEATITPYDGPILRVAIMGIGTYGNIVARALQASTKAKLVGVISGSPAKVKDWQTKYGIPDKNVYNYDNFEDIKNNPDIDAIYVIVPNFLHKPYVLRAAKTGKHVISEKPLGLNGKEAQEIVDGCKKAGVKLLVGYRMHFEPKNLEIIAMRKAGDFGKIQYFTGNGGFRIGGPQWRLEKDKAGGGSMMDIGIYAINGARYMIGEDPIWVTAQEAPKSDPVKFKEGVDETITFQMGFPSGAVAQCLSTYAMNNVDRFLLIGTRGYAELNPANGYGPLKGRTHRGDLKAVSPPMQQTIQMDEMAGIFLEGKTAVVPVDGEEAVKDAKIIDAVYAAVKSGQKVSLKL